MVCKHRKAGAAPATVSENLARSFATVLLAWEGIARGMQVSLHATREPGDRPERSWWLAVGEAEPRVGPVACPSFAFPLACRQPFGYCMAARGRAAGETTLNKTLLAA